MTPELLAALIGKIAIPELLRWLAERRASGVTVITEEEALAKLERDVTEGNADGMAILAAYHA